MDSDLIINKINLIKLYIISIYTALDKKDELQAALGNLNSAVINIKQATSQHNIAHILKNSPLLPTHLFSSSLSHLPHNHIAIMQFSKLLWELCCDETGNQLFAIQPKKSLYDIPQPAWTIPQTVGSQKAFSLYELCSTASGLKALEKLPPTFFQNIPKLAWTLECREGEHPGTTPLYWLCCTPIGNHILKKLPPDLLADIPATAWISSPTKGTHQGKTAFYWLCDQQQGLHILSTLPPTFFLNLPQKTWTKRPKKNSFSHDASAFYLLCSNLLGRYILDKLPNAFFENIPIKAWTRTPTNSIAQLATPLHYLCCDETYGHKLLLEKGQIILERISLNTLNSSYTDNHGIKQTMLSILLMTDSGRSILTKYAAQVFDRLILGGEVHSYTLLHNLYNTICNALYKQIDKVKTTSTLFSSREKQAVETVATTFTKELLSNPLFWPALSQTDDITGSNFLKIEHAISIRQHNISLPERFIQMLTRLQTGHDITESTSFRILGPCA